MTRDITSYEALFIDIDGTAVNSEPLIRVVVGEMAAAAGITIVPDDWKIFGGLGDKGVWQKLCERSPDFAGHYATGAAFEAQRLLNYQERMGEVQAHAPVLELVEIYLAAHKEVFAVTNSTREMATKHLTVTGYPMDKMGLFAEADAHDRGLNSKPDIGLYSLAFHTAALNRLGRGVSAILHRHDCLVLEDSPNGARAGLRENMAVIHLTDMNLPLSESEIKRLINRSSGAYYPMSFADLGKAQRTDDEFLPSPAAYRPPHVNGHAAEALHYLPRQ